MRELFIPRQSVLLEQAEQVTAPATMAAQAHYPGLDCPLLMLVAVVAEMALVEQQRLLEDLAAEVLMALLAQRAILAAILLFQKAMVEVMGPLVLLQILPLAAAVVVLLPRQMQVLLRQRLAALAF